MFVTNGPLLRVTAGGQLPGHQFDATGSSLDLLLEGRLDCNDPIERVELIHNAKVRRVSLPARVTLDESGWFLVRAVTPLSDTLRFASTGPFYVNLKDSPGIPQQRQSARFFVDWCDERIANLETNSELAADKKDEVIGPWREARAFWDKKRQAAPLEVNF